MVSWYHGIPFYIVEPTVILSTTETRVGCCSLFLHQCLFLLELELGVHKKRESLDSFGPVGTTTKINNNITCFRLDFL